MNSSLPAGLFYFYRAEPKFNQKSFIPNIFAVIHSHFPKHYKTARISGKYSDRIPNFGMPYFGLSPLEW